MAKRHFRLNGSARISATCSLQAKHFSGLKTTLCAEGHLHSRARVKIEAGLPCSLKAGSEPCVAYWVAFTGTLLAAHEYSATKTSASNTALKQM